MTIIAVDRHGELADLPAFLEERRLDQSRSRPASRETLYIVDDETDRVIAAVSAASDFAAMKRFADEDAAEDSGSRVHSTDATAFETEQRLVEEAIHADGASTASPEIGDLERAFYPGLTDEEIAELLDASTSAGRRSELFAAMHRLEGDAVARVAIPVRP